MNVIASLQRLVFPYHLFEVVSVCSVRNDDALVFQVVVREVSEAISVDAFEDWHNVRHGHWFEGEQHSGVLAKVTEIGVQRAIIANERR